MGASGSVVGEEELGADASGGETLTLGATNTFGVLTVSSNSSNVNTANRSREPMFNDTVEKCRVPVNNIK